MDVRGENRYLHSVPMEAVMEKKSVLPNQSGQVSSYSLRGPAGFRLTSILLTVVLLSTLVVQRALAGGGGVNLYVATFGIDSGNCLVLAAPCRTITYAMSQASSYDNIHIAAGTYYENLVVNENLDFYGAGMNATILDGGSAGQVIYDGSYNLLLMDMTIRNGYYPTGTGGGISHWGGTLTMNRVKVTDNIAHTGGGIFSNGLLNMTDCMINGNQAVTDGANDGTGGGIFLQSSNTANLNNVTIHGNTASGVSGGLHNQRNGTVNLTNVTVTNNLAGKNGALTTTNSSTLNILNSTIVYNYFHSGGSNGGIGNYATANFKNTIVAGNQGANCSGSGSLVTQGSNLDSGNTCGFNHPSDYRNTDPLLGPLADNGGYTLTHALLVGSPAIDSGTNVGCTSKDQRSMPRPKDGNLNGVATCDIGAYEFPDSTFADVPATHSAWSYIERLYAAGITSGCGAGNYCPLVEVNRAQMAIFLLRGMHGGSYTPPAVGGSTGFDDVPLTESYAPWVKQLAAEGITAGCGGGNFCPLQNVNRAQMAIFLLRAKYGSTYSPPAVGATTGFGDVPVAANYAPWVVQLAAEGITAGCGGGNFCPLQSVNRAQMAIFLVRAFGLP
jgi:hypothetical protein